LSANKAFDVAQQQSPKQVQPADLDVRRAAFRRLRHFVFQLVTVIGKRSEPEETAAPLDGVNMSLDGHDIVDAGNDRLDEVSKLGEGIDESVSVRHQASENAEHLLLPSLAAFAGDAIRAIGRDDENSRKHTLVDDRKVFDVEQALVGDAPHWKQRKQTSRSH
jgi:hypothetical protein